MSRRLDYWIGAPLVSLGRLLPVRPASPAPLRRILVIKLAAAGDTVLLVPALRALRAAHPAASIDWLVSPINAGLARTIPYVDAVSVTRARPGLRLLGLCRDLRRRRYDAVIDFEQWARGTALVAAATGAPVRVGFDTPGQRRASAFTHVVRKDFRRHERDDFLALAAHLAPGAADAALELWETDAGRAEAAARLPARTGRLRAILHPGCGADGLPREWPIASYAALGRWLRARCGAEILLTGGPEERSKTAGLLQCLDGEAVDLAGRLSWPGLVSVVAQTDVVISGNTGVMHVAAALRRPQVALHGPTNPALWGPLNDRARVIQSDCPQCPCLELGFEYHRRDQACMARIGVAQVTTAIEALLALRV